MYDDEPRKRTPMFATIGAILFGVGLMWSGTYGLQFALHGFHGTSNQAAALESITNFNDFKQTVSETNTYIQRSTSSVELPSTTTTILIGGDVMFDRKIRSMGQKSGYDSLFTSLSPLFKTANIVIANLEGPITTYPSKTLLKSGVMTDEMAFTFAPTVAKTLSDIGITAVSLANNHEDNFGVQGVTETKKWLKGSGVQWFGTPWNASSTELVVNRNGMTIAFVGYHAFEPGVNRVLADVKRLADQGDFVVVMPHWGVEYSSHPTNMMRSEARAFIAAGAKAIIGSHPHVIMDNETIAGVPVYYSVGNLLFDQYFSSAVMHGEIVSLKLTSGPAGPTLASIQTFNTQLDKIKGVVLK